MHVLQKAARDYLLEKWPGCEAVEIENFGDLPGGYSKSTYRFDAKITKNGETRLYPMILRIDPPLASAIVITSREVEHFALCRVREHTKVPVPTSYFVEMRPEVFGNPAIIMERVLGSTTPTELWTNPERAAEAEQLATDLCEKLAALHMSDHRVLNYDGAFNDPRGRGIVPESWDRYMDETLQHLITNFRDITYDAAPVYYDGLLQMRRKKPRPLPLAFIHGEVNPSNLVFQNGKLTALVDWELVHIGDPREDLGWFRHMDAATGTKFFSSVKHPGGFLGYYNHLTGFNVTEGELEYFQMFSFLNTFYTAYHAITKRIQGHHQEICHMYMTQFLVGGTKMYSQLLKYPSAS